MKNWKFDIFCLFAILLLIGVCCKQKDTYREPVIKVTKDTTKLKILFIGDSFTAYENSYADQLKSLFPDKIEIKKIAKIGKTTYWMYNELLKELKINKYSIVFILGGYNDVYSLNGLDNTKCCIEGMLRIAKEYNIISVIITVPPSGNNINYDRVKQKYMDDLNNGLMESHANYKIDLYSLIEDYIISGFPNPKYVIKDGEHLNKKGHELLVKEIIKLYKNNISGKINLK